MLTRRHKLALAIGIVATLTFAVTAPEGFASKHTPYNHFALLADAWLHGRLHLGGPPPDYTGGNDFAVFDDARGHARVFVSFPPFPALLLVPFVAVAGSPEKVPDGLLFVLLGGVGPAVLFLALEKLRDLGRSFRNQRENVALSLLFALGTVYWFSAVQGTVWFAAHVVGVACCATYLWASIDAERPLIAGLALGLGLATRTPLLFAAPFFALELHGRWRRDHEPVQRAVARFALPLIGVLAILAWHNHARFGDPLEFGHRHLVTAWSERIQRWGLFSPHYLGRNLGVVLGGVPFWGEGGGRMRIGSHGLALWITSPFLLWLLAPRPRRNARRTALALGVAATAVALPSLLYQNSGWLQFGYRFSNDFAPLLFLLLALVRPRLGPAFLAAAAFAIVVNALGAISFQRPGFERWYASPRMQDVFEPD